MSTIEQVKTADKKMAEARRALLDYTDRSQSEPQDTAKHRKLAKALKEATDEYMRLVLDLNSK